VRGRVAGREQQVHALRDAAARLLHEQLPVVVGVVAEVAQFGVHAGEVLGVGDPGRYYVADFAFGVDGCYEDCGRGGGVGG
jgi:hypothetical protein